MAAEFLGVEIGREASVIETLVDDNPLDALLAPEVFVEHPYPIDGGIGHVHVADAAAGGLGDLAAIALDPVQVVQSPFAGDRPDRDLPGALLGGFVVDLQRDQASGEALEA